VLGEMRPQEGGDGAQMRCQEVRPEVRAQVCCQVRAEELMRRLRTSVADLSADAAAVRLLETYAALANVGQHLLASLLDGRAPQQWAHYPDHDAIDQTNGYQWFYHSHSPEDRAGADEHGHIHLFARRRLWARRLRSRSETDFAALCGVPASDLQSRHLLAIGFDAKGLPITLFTVNSWVTGDAMLGAELTLDLLKKIRIDSGHPHIDAVIMSVIAIYQAELHQLLEQRDACLRATSSSCNTQNRSLELLSELHIQLDARLSDLRDPAHASS
jgi:hypothetical protein